MRIMNRIIIENLTLSYRRHPAVHHISGEFSAGSLTAITGPNGGGKSTLLKALAGLLPPTDGRITMQGFDKNDIAYLPQLTEMRMDFPISVLQMVSCGQWRHHGGLGTISRECRTKARTALHAVGLDGFEDRQISTLSSGQLQRVLFARLMLQDAQLILLDEPFNAIDEDTTEKLLGIIHSWHAEGRTIIAVVHEKQMILKHFPQCMLLARECIGWGASAGVLADANLHKASHFRAAWQSHPEVCEQ